MQFKSFYHGQVVTKEFYPQILSVDSICCVLFFGTINGFFYNKVLQFFLQNGFSAPLFDNLKIIFLLIACICFSIFLILRFSPQANMFFVTDDGLQILYCGFSKLYKWENITEFYGSLVGDGITGACFFDYYNSKDKICTTRFTFAWYNGLNPLEQAEFFNRKLDEFTSKA